MGYEWREPTSRFGVRLSAEYTSSVVGSRPLFDYGLDGIASVGTTRSRDQQVSLSALTTFALSTGRIQPYLVSGLMLQHGSLETHFAYDASAPAELRFGPDGSREQSFRYSDISLGAQAGLGLRGRIGRAWLFTEARAHAPALFSGSRPAQRRAAPITFGIQFE